MSGKNKKNPLNAITRYFKEVRAELKKVVWPTIKQIKNNTIIVIISLVLVGAIIWVLDLGFASTLGRVVDKAAKPGENQMIDSEMPPMDGGGLPIEGMEDFQITDDGEFDVQQQDGQDLADGQQASEQADDQ